MSEEKNNEKVNVIEQLELKLESESKNYTNRVYDILKMMSSMSQLSEAQIFLLSLRQEIVDRKRQAKYLINKQKSKLLTKQNERTLFYRTQSSLRHDPKDIKLMVDSETTIDSTMINLLESQTTFYDDTIATLTSMQFAIKNKIELESSLM